MKTMHTPKSKLADHCYRRFRALLLGLLAALATTGFCAQPLTLVKKLTAYDGTATNYFGVSVAMDGDLIVVGAGYQNLAGYFQGSAYLYERNVNGPNHWGLRKKLYDAVSGGSWDLFGYSVSVSGDVIVAGAPGKTYWTYGQAGWTYVFERNEGGPNNWGIPYAFGFNYGGLDALWGISVSVSGDTFVSGTRQADVGANGDQGVAQVWTNHPSGGWLYAKTLIASDGAAGDYFGYKVAMSGDVVVVGAPRDDVGPNADQGSAYVFGRNVGGAGQWGFVKKLTASDGAAGDNFSHFSVSLSGTTLVVGAVYHDEGFNANQGAAYIFERDAGGPNNWGEVKKLTASDGTTNDYFGFAALSGDLLVVGASGRRVGTNANQGAAYVFERHAGGDNNWGQTQQLIAPDGKAGDSLGWAGVAVSGDTAVVGASSQTVRGNFYQGAAYVFAPPWEAGLGLAKVTNGLRVTIAGTPGRRYELERTTNVLGDWLSLTNRTIPIEGVVEHLDTNAPQPAGFYRAFRN